MGKVSTSNNSHTFFFFCVLFFIVLYVFFFFFFFQAEDGIRDKLVTGVQTCALPISVEGLSESISFELEEFGIRVIVIEPGVVKSDFFHNVKVKGNLESPYQKLMERSEERRVGKECRFRWSTYH